MFYNNGENGGLPSGCVCVTAGCLITFLPSSATERSHDVSLSQSRKIHVKSFSEKITLVHG